MSSKSDMATAYFNCGFNCAQSVLSVFCEKYGMDRNIALRVCSGLGSGFRSGEICGAVSGAALVIGLKYGWENAESRVAKDYCNQKIVEFMNLFRAENKSVVCRDILGFDVSVKEEYEHAREQNLFKTTCVNMVVNAVILLEELEY